MMNVGLSTWRPHAAMALKPRFGETNSPESSPADSSNNQPGNPSDKGDSCRALVVYDPTIVMAPRISQALLAAQQVSQPYTRRAKLASALEQAEMLGDWHYLKTQATLAVADNLLNNPYHANERAEDTEQRLKRALVLYRGIKSQCLKTSRNGLNDTTKPLTTLIMLKMGHTLLGLGELDEAEEHYKGVLAVSQTRKHLRENILLPVEVGEAYLGLSKIAKQDTRLEEALEYGEKSVAVFRAHPLSWKRVHALRQYQDILHVLGDNARADLIETELKQARKALKATASN